MRSEDGANGSEGCVYDDETQNSWARNLVTPAQLFDIEVLANDVWRATVRRCERGDDAGAPELFALLAAVTALIEELRLTLM
jgi:hypothetical protein